MSWQQLAYGVVGVFFVVLMVWERLRPAAPLPRSGSWYLRILVVAALTGITGRIMRFLWASIELPKLPTRVLEGLSPAIQGVVMFLLFSFINYGWHYLRHRNSLLWRVFHQLHHSPVRIETLTAYYEHPIEAVVSSILVMTMSMILGISLDGSFVMLAFFYMSGLFRHANIRTPAFLDYIVGTPELHRIHHIEGKHWGNFAMFPWIDRMFGTFVPRQIPEPVVPMGFANGLEQRLGNILTFQDVLAPSEQATAR